MIDLFASFKPASAASTECPAGTFPLENQMHATDKAKAKLRAMRKKFIHARNCEPIISTLPEEEGDQLHCIVGGNFIFGDLIAMICQRTPCKKVWAATLSMSLKNIESLVSCIEQREIESLELLVSHFFVNGNPVEREKLQNARENLGVERLRLGVARNHAKVTLIDQGTRKLVILSSANYRSSDNIEDIAIHCDSDLYEFHRAWIEKLILTSTEKNRSQVEESATQIAKRAKKEGA